MKDHHTELAEQYFDFTARHFPVMCASDEFHFLPRSQAAQHYYDQMEQFDPETIRSLLSEVKHFQAQFSEKARNEKNIEKQIDLEILAASASGVLITLEENQLWRRDPLLYLKIAFIGLDHALTKPAYDQKEQNERVLSRLRAIPGLLGQAVHNLKNIPDIYRRSAQEMVQDCRAYLREINGRPYRPSLTEKMGPLLDDVDASLKRFGAFLEPAPGPPNAEDKKVPLERILKDHFLSLRSLDEIFDIAVEQRRQALEKLNSLKSRIDTKKSWLMIYIDYTPREAGGKSTMALYRQEIKHMEAFFRRQGIVPRSLNLSLSFEKTPTYLRSVRSSASFSAAFTDDDREENIFYLTPSRDEKSHTIDRLAKRLNREYKFLTAHETIPGHHLLDSFRRSLENPVRRQIESPLFYEGWAFYAETLLTEFGYVTEPIEQLVDFKRRLWRAARCQIDVGMFTGRLSMENAVNLLMETGFSETESLGQIKRFRLNPGYQLCYSLGYHEIKKLRDTFQPEMGIQRFHENVLIGGQIPFHLIEKRLRRLQKGRQAE